jgi:hypothetical protein
VLKVEGVQKSVRKVMKASGISESTILKVEKVCQNVRKYMLNAIVNYFAVQMAAP